MSTISERKQALRAKVRAERRAEAAVRHSHWRCFWTWPLGHVWARTGDTRWVKCVGCDWERSWWREA